MKATMMDCVTKRVLFVSIFTLCLLGTGLAKHVVQHFPKENNGTISASTDSSVQTQPSKDDRQLPPYLFPGDDIDSSTEVLPTSSAPSMEDKHLPPLIFPGGSSSEGHLPPEVFPKTPDLPPSISPRESLSTVAPKSEQNVPTAKSNESKLVSDKNTDNTTAGANKETLTDKYASEVPDLLNTDKYNRTVYEDGTEPPVEKDTVTVQGPNVVNMNKTHEEDITTSIVQKSSNKTKIESVTENKNNVVTSTVPPLNNNETTTEDHQNFNTTLAEHAESNVTSAEGTTRNGNEEKVAPKNEKSISSTTPKTVAPIPDTQSNKTMENPKVKNDSLPEGSKEKKKSDNKTVKDDVTSESSTSASKESTAVPTPSKPVTEASSAVVQTTLKAESSTSVDISENLIDHKAEAMIGSQDHADHQHASMGKTSAFLQPTESAAILAGVFVGIALIGYVGLLIWRRVLEKRYGNREMLVNEDDFYDTNDLRNFEL